MCCFIDRRGLLRCFTEDEVKQLSNEKNNAYHWNNLYIKCYNLSYLATLIHVISPAVHRFISLLESFPLKTDKAS